MSSSATEKAAPPPHRGAFLLTILILVGLFLGVVVGEWLYRAYDADVPAHIVGAFEFVGRMFFMNLLKMILVPLVVTSVIVGVASIGDPSRLGWIGGMTLVYYFITMLVAVVTGLALVTFIQPGSGMDEAFRDAQIAEFEQTQKETVDRVESARQTGLWGALRNLVTQIIPSNPLKDAVEGHILPVIAFSILVGIAMTVVRDAASPLLRVITAALAVIMKLVDWILWLAPLGAFALMAWTVARIGLKSLSGPLLKYVVTVGLGLTIHAVVTLPTILFLLSRVNPLRFFWQMRAALLTAFATDSSSATLPVTMDVAEEQGGCSRRASRFVLPLGATINMDGTALYEAVAVVFLFQSFGFDLRTTELAVIAMTATLAAVGAAGIPSAGLVTMVIVVEAVNTSLGGDKTLPLSAVGIILGIDRILDMCRTTVNVWGDAVGARVITELAPDESLTG